MSGHRRSQFSTVIYMSVFALVVNNLSAQNSVHFYTSSPPVSTTEQASVVVEQHEVASGRSIRGGSFRQTNQNNYNNPNERPLRTTGFAFKGRNSFGDDGQTSPIPFLIPSYASGIIFRNSDNDRSPQVEIQPSIHIASKTIGPEEEEEEQQSATASNGNRGGIDSTRTRTTITTTTPSTYRGTRPTSNVNLANSFERRTFTPLQTTSFRASTVTQSSIVQNEIQNNSPMQSALTTLSPPFAPSQIHSRPTIDKATQQPRFADITKRIEVLGLQSPGYAIRNDGTIDSDALPPNFVVNTNTNFASNNLNPLDFDTAASTTTTQMTFTTTPRVTRTTKPFQQHFLPTAFIPSNDNPFLPHRQSKQQNLNATPAPFTSFQSSGTHTTNTFKGSTTFATTTVNNRRNQHARGNGFTTSFAPPQASAKSSAFSKTGINQHSPTGQFANQPNSRQSKSHNELSFNAQQQAQRKNSQIVLDLDNRARLPPFGITETTPFPTLPAAASSSSFGGFTTKRVQSFANSPIPTAKAPAGFSFAAFAKTTPRPRIVATTNAPTTFSTIFPSKYTFSTIPTTVAPAQLAQSDESPPVNAAAAPSIELLPPITSITADAKSAFAPINEAGALVRPKSPAFSAGATNRNQQQQHHPKNNIKPFNAPQKVNNGFTAFPITTTTTRRPIITTTTRSPIRHRPTFSTTPFKFTTTTARPTTTAAAITTTPFASFHHQNQPNAQAQLPYTDLLPPIESDSQTKESAIVPSTNSFVQQLSPSISLPNDDLLPPLPAASDAQTQTQTQNSRLPNAAPNSIHTSNENEASVAGAAHIKASTGTKTKTDHQPNAGLDLNPFLPPVDAVANAPAATNANTESNSQHNNNDYTTITLEQNPFLPQLDLNPFLPPFVFTPSENDPGFGFGAGTPPPKDEDTVDDDANAS